MRKAAVLWTAAACLVCQSAAGQEKLSYVDLAGRLTDLERLAVLPQPGEKCMQWSSYDRRSKYDAKTGKYVDWSANGDGTGIIRAEGDQVVVAEIDGPGCIWRIWSARATGGHVLIYLDDDEKPAVDLPFADYFNRKVKPFVYPSLVHMTARGINNYVPIPFQKSCRIVAAKGWGQYYHFTYGLFPKGTKVPTFKMALSAEETAALAAADETLTKKLGTDPAPKRPGTNVETNTVTVKPGKTTVVAELVGPRSITGLQVKLPELADREEEMAVLRQLALRITWDAAASPQVWSPLGDFFGTAPGVNPHRSLPLGLSKDGGYCYWYMPFAKQAKIELANDGEAARTVGFVIAHAPLTRPIETLGRFHAKWHRDAFLPPEPQRRIDWTMLTTTGRGRFCGVNLHVWNPRGGWWGEGDEKFFVDGEKFPSTFGTGSEDYFGYAWCNPTLFQNAYHNQTISQGNRGHVSVNRWHVTDNVPFQKSFRAEIEKYYPNAKPTLYAAIACWYQAPGGKDPYPPAPMDQRWGYCTKPKLHTVKGAIEGEKLKVLQRSGGRSQVQDMGGFPLAKWSHVAHLWWIDGKPGDKLVLSLPVKRAGKFEVKAALTKAIDYGIVQLSLDGKKLGKPIDLFNDGVITTGELSFGVHELTQGGHKLTVEITGSHPKAVKRHMFGLDYVLLKAVE